MPFGRRRRRRRRRSVRGGHHLLQQVAVECRVLVLRVGLEHLLIGVDSRFEFALPRERIAEVVEIAQVLGQLREDRRALDEERVTPR